MSSSSLVHYFHQLVALVVVVCYCYCAAQPPVFSLHICDKLSLPHWTAHLLGALAAVVIVHVMVRAEVTRSLIFRDEFCALLGSQELPSNHVLRSDHVRWFGQIGLLCLLFEFASDLEGLISFFCPWLFVSVMLGRPSIVVVDLLESICSSNATKLCSLL